MLIFLIVIYSLCWSILISAGELLQIVGRKLRGIKLLTCPYCIAGQLAVWSFVFPQLIIFLETYYLVPGSIVVTYYISKINDRLNE